MKRLLVIDDDGAAVAALRELLEMDGYDVWAFQSATAALEALGGVDAVITDLEMPDLHGVQVIRKIRERSQVPIVVVTGYPGSPAARMACEAGAALVLDKPLDYDGLTAALRNFFA